MPLAIHMVVNLLPECGGDIDMAVTYQYTDGIPITIVPIDSETIEIDFTIEDNNDYILCMQGIKDTLGNEMLGPIQYTISSIYTPLYATTRQIRTDIGSAIVDIPDSTVYNVIRSNSLYVDQIYTTQINPSNIPYEVQQYVRYQSEVDLILNRYAQNTSGSTSEFTLGDFSVSNSTTSQSSMKYILGELQRRADYWLKKLQTTTSSSVKSFVKGGTNWPDYMSRGF